MKVVDDIGQAHALGVMALVVQASSGSLARVTGLAEGRGGLAGAA